MSSNDRLQFSCPHCQRTVSVPTQHAGKKGKCPGCGQVIPIPATSEASAQRTVAESTGTANHPAQLPDLDFPTLVEMSMHELELKTAAHDGAWRLSEASWDLDQEAGTIVFTTPQGIVATCSVQIVGTFNSTNNSWLWGWDHPSVLPPLQKHARWCRDYGVQHNLDILTYQDIELDDEDGAWQLAAFACKLANAQGVYRGPAGGTKFVFVTFGEPRLAKSQ
jgi:ribosomal protein S27E